MAKRNKTSAAALDGMNDQIRAATSRPAVRVECPREGEAIAGPCYSFHIAAAPGTMGVEVSVDQGGWMPCREALGLWWFDWSGFDKGDHELTARALIGDGISASSSPRLFSAR